MDCANQQRLADGPGGPRRPSAIGICDHDTAALPAHCFRHMHWLALASCASPSMPLQLRTSDPSWERHGSTRSGRDERMKMDEHSNMESAHSDARETAATSCKKPLSMRRKADPHGGSWMLFSASAETRRAASAASGSPGTSPADTHTDTHNKKHSSHEQ